MAFKKFEEIQAVGYKAAIEMLERFGEEGKLPSVHLQDGKNSARVGKKGRSVRRNSI
jgi:lysophospholipid hydrolase